VAPAGQGAGRAAIDAATFQAERQRLAAAHARGVYFLLGRSKLQPAAGRGVFARALLAVNAFMVNNVPATTAMYHVGVDKTLELSNT
jgi:hypothetical protein